MSDFTEGPGRNPPPIPQHGHTVGNGKYFFKVVRYVYYGHATGTQLLDQSEKKLDLGVRQA